MKRPIVPLALVGLLALALPGLSQEQQAPDAKGAKIQPSGLQVVFPPEARCPEIASPFGSQTRYDGSRRPPWEFGGFHGGIDISLAEGTPLLAVAAGSVAAKGAGGPLEGNYLWLRHSPEESGLHDWLYSKYQHLQSLPELPIGAKVVVGQVIARSGKTGTAGPHYGRNGYPHLHLTMRASPTGDLEVGSRGSTGGGELIDPLVLFHESGAKPGKSDGPPSGEKTVKIPYVTAGGQLRPPGARAVWPIPCQPR